MEINLFQLIIIILIIFILIMCFFNNTDLFTDKINTNQYNLLLKKYYIVINERNKWHQSFIELNNDFQLNKQNNLINIEKPITQVEHKTENINIYENQIGTKTSSHSNTIIPRNLFDSDNEIIKQLFL